MRDTIQALAITILVAAAGTARAGSIDDARRAPRGISTDCQFRSLAGLSLARLVVENHTGAAQGYRLEVILRAGARTWHSPVVAGNLAPKDRQERSFNPFPAGIMITSCSVGRAGVIPAPPGAGLDPVTGSWGHVAAVSDGARPSSWGDTGGAPYFESSLRVGNVFGNDVQMGFLFNPAHPESGLRADVGINLGVYDRSGSTPAFLARAVVGFRSRSDSSSLAYGLQVGGGRASGGAVVGSVGGEITGRWIGVNGEVLVSGGGAGTRTFGHGAVGVDVGLVFRGSAGAWSEGFVLVILAGAFLGSLSQAHLG